MSKRTRITDKVYSTTCNHELQSVKTETVTLGALSQIGITREIPKHHYHEIYAEYVRIKGVFRGREIERLVKLPCGRS